MLLCFYHNPYLCCRHAYALAYTLSRIASSSWSALQCWHCHSDTRAFSKLENGYEQSVRMHSFVQCIPMHSLITCIHIADVSINCRCFAPYNSPALNQTQGFSKDMFDPATFVHDTGDGSSKTSCHFGGDQSSFVGTLSNLIHATCRSTRASRSLRLPIVLQATLRVHQLGLVDPSCFGQIKPTPKD